MNQTIQNLLNGKGGNHMLPFFWQHGESEEVLVEYVAAIQNANCNAFCVESRPHPDFCGEGWWRDMDIILREAKARGMQVWILDDSHFPTGYANGAAESVAPELSRQSIYYNKVHCSGQAKSIKLQPEKYCHPGKIKMNMQQRIMMSYAGKQKEFPRDTERIYSIVAISAAGERQDLTGKTQWDKPEGVWDIYYCYLSHNLGYHRNYINMMMEDSCRLLIDAVYEKHYEHYSEYFGNTIAGFFSDEPELGNGIIYQKHNVLGTEQDLPWSLSLENELGEKFKEAAPLLWCSQGEPDKIAETRYAYMDAVTRLVQKSFSEQVGNWCREHGVMYIGHLIEDDDTHTCTGSGLGHYFRGISGQDMAGIDDIGGQVLPQGEYEPTKAAFGMPRNGGFYHYTLGKLGVSAAYLDEKKMGRTMCEIFGNYGWSLDMKTMKYLADHFMVRGVNYFVPHAFSPKDYPDPDCPPHFYAHGNNPLYRAFSELCGYMNRVSELITGGHIVCQVAILYNAEAEWMGKAMPLNTVAGKLYDNQIDYLFLPIDKLERASEFKCVVIPEAEYWDERVAQIPNSIFIERLPNNIREGKVVALEKLVDAVKERISEGIELMPSSDRIRVYHYKHHNDLFYLVNEGAEKYKGTIALPVKGDCYRYDAWNNCIEEIEQRENGIVLELDPSESFIIVFDSDSDISDMQRSDSVETKEKKTDFTKRSLKEWSRSICTAKEYPDFKAVKKVTIPDHVEKELPKFSGFIRYEMNYVRQDEKELLLEIANAADAVEVFVNGESKGIQIIPPYRYNLTDAMKEGVNTIAIEVATTLERDQAFCQKKSFVGKLLQPKVNSSSGLIGEVTMRTR